MIPGTRPARRSARAAPLPARERAVALIRLTVAMMISSSKALSYKRNSAASLQGCCSGCRRRAYSGAGFEKQGMMARRRLGRTVPGLTAASGAGLAERRLQRGDACLVRLFLLARQAGHVLDRLEILALDHVEIAQNALRLVAEQRLDLAPHPLRGAGGVVHQPRDLVEEPVCGLDHGYLRTPGVPLDMPADNGDGAARSQEVRRNESRQPAVDESQLMLVVLFAVLPVLPFPAINPILIAIGPLAVRWYALAYIVGIIAGWFYARAIIASERFWGGPAPLTVIDFDDFVIWITLGIILGGRTGYVLFYNLPHFIEQPLQIFELWNGVMSFHGGVAGCIVAIVAFALKRGIPMLSLADVTAAVCPIGLFLGRVANFINGELWGRPTDVSWAMIFPNGGPLPRHPSQLYEAALEGLVLL